MPRRTHYGENIRVLKQFDVVFVKIQSKEHEILPDNFNNSINRLVSLLKRLKRILTEYDNIKQQECDGIIEKYIIYLTTW